MQDKDDNGNRVAAKNHRLGKETAMERLLMADEVREYLRVSDSTLWRWCRDGKITTLRTPGGRLRFRESDVQKVLREEAEAEPS